MRTTAYRYPGERLTLAVTLLAVLLVIALTAAATVCGSLVFIVMFLIISASSLASHHQALMRAALPVTRQSAPGLSQVSEEALMRLQPGNVQVYVLPSKEFNAYTFGLGGSKVVVLYSALLEHLDAEETQFVLGHEMGHVALGHTRLNSLVGGMAGIPAAGWAGIALSVVFLWWNRSCEFSADRAGLLACDRLDKAISALVKVGVGPGVVKDQAAFEQALQLLDAQDDSPWAWLNESLATHPLVIRRINELRRYAASAGYQRLRQKLSNVAAQTGQN